MAEDPPDQTRSADRERPFEPATLTPRPVVSPRTFAALDLRVGRVVDVVDFPRARRPAWRLRVDFGPRIGVLSTSAQVTNYSRAELVGRQVVGAINIGTRNIGGFVSEFLLLGGMEADGAVRLLSVDGELPPGAPIA